MGTMRQPLNHKSLGTPSPGFSWCFCWSELVSKDHCLIPTVIRSVSCMSLPGGVYAGGRGVAMSPEPATHLYRLP